MSNGDGKLSSKEMEKQKKLEEKRRSDFLKWQKLWEVDQKNCLIAEKACLDSFEEMEGCVEVMRSTLAKIDELDKVFSKQIMKFRKELERLSELEDQLDKNLELLRKKLLGLKDDIKKKGTDTVDGKKLVKDQENLEKDEDNLDKQIKLLRKQMETIQSKCRELEKKHRVETGELRKIGTKHAKDYRNEANKLETPLKKHRLLIEGLKKHLKSFNSSDFAKAYAEMGKMLEKEIQDGLSGPTPTFEKDREKLHKKYELYLDKLTPSITKTL